MVDVSVPQAPGPSVKRVMVGTDRSATADRAVRWAANLAASYNAELLLLQILVPQDGNPENVPEVLRTQAGIQLQRFAEEHAGPRGRSLVVVGSDPAQAVIDAVASQNVDVVVVGNVGMAGRKEFLLGNVPNRISHNAHCTVVIVNTARPDEQTGDPKQRPNSQRGIAPDRLEGALLRRAWRIGRVIVKTGVRELLSRSRFENEDATRAAAVRVREALDELGPTFAKLGQILSTRPDLIPPAFIDELASLQERVTPLSEAEVVEVMEAELGVPWEDVFESIDPSPLAAGTIAQVHRATLESGDRVVVKVQRPTAQEDILQDLGLLELFADKAMERPALRRVFDVPVMVRTLSASLRRELDFREEASNIKRMSGVLKPFARLDVPGVYEEYSSARLLVMQEIQGVAIQDAPIGPERREAAQQLLEGYYHQVMTEGFFHADPHPGNMKWWKDKIYFLDLGMVGEVDADVRQLILMLLLAFSQRDAKFLSEIVFLLAGTEGNRDIGDISSFQSDLELLIERYRSLSLQEIELGPMLQEITAVSIRHNIRLPASLALTGKAFSQMQLAAAELDPTLDPFKVAESYILRSVLRRAASYLDPQTILYEAQRARTRVSRVVEALEGAVGARPGSNLQVNFRGTERLEDTIVQASRQLSLALSASGALAVTAMTANSERTPRWIPMMMGSVGTALAGALLIHRPRRRN
jgi:ubiquinone biosynthesis protein